MTGCFSVQYFPPSVTMMWGLSEPNIFSTNGSLDYFHRSSSNEMRAYKIEQEYLSSDQDPEPHSVSCKFPGNLVIEAMKNSVIYILGQVF